MERVRLSAVHSIQRGLLISSCYSSENIVSGTVLIYAGTEFSNKNFMRAWRNLPWLSFAKVSFAFLNFSVTDFSACLLTTLTRPTLFLIFNNSGVCKLLPCCSAFYLLRTFYILTVEVKRWKNGLRAIFQTNQDTIPYYGWWVALY